jgi:hypothetical protein
VVRSSCAREWALKATTSTTSVYPRPGRLACVDLADYLACWRPGCRADLHVIPGALDPARDAIDRLGSAYGGVGALNLDLHPDMDGPENPLVELDRLASHCRERFLAAEDGRFIYTSSERLDGRTGTADLLVIAGPTPDPQADDQKDRA